MTWGMKLQTAFIIPPSPTTEHSVLYGHLFEMYCLAKLAEGGSFPMRSLDEPGELCMPSNGKAQLQTAFCHLM